MITKKEELQLKNWKAHYNSLLGQIQNASSRLTLTYENLKEVDSLYSAKKLELQEADRLLVNVEKAIMSDNNKVEELKLKRSDLLQDIKNKKDELSALRKEIVNLRKDYESSKTHIKKELIELNVVREEQESINHNLLNEKSLLEEGIKEVKKERNARVADAEAILKKLNSEIHEATKTLEKIKKDFGVRIKEAGELEEHANRAAATTSEERKRVQFYARRLKKYYTQKELPIPKDLGEVFAGFNPIKLKVAKIIRRRK